MNLLMSLRAKGGAGVAARVGTITSRFSVTAARMERYLTHYVALAGRYDARPTLPITACVLTRHPGLIRRFAESGVEFAIHGLVHNDHAVLSLEAQRQSISKAVTIFRNAGVPCAGFRAPYLRYNQATIEAVRSLGLRYHSSQAVAFPVLPPTVAGSPRAAAYARALQFYEARDAARVAVRPHARYGLIDIPVAVPDDEILVDRLRLNRQAQAAAWLAILERTHARGELFTMQLHPERILECAYALRVVLEEARRRRPQVWIAQLDDIASWWQRRQQMALQVRQSAPERYAVHLEGTGEATLVVRGLPAVDAAAWCGPDRSARTHSFEVSAAVKPMVGVSPRSPAVVLDFLREEGIPAETATDKGRFGAYLDIADGELDELAILQEIERSAGPLIRLGRWPNGARSALAVTGDIDAVTLQDFALRSWETRS